MQQLLKLQTQFEFQVIDGNISNGEPLTRITSFKSCEEYNAQAYDLLLISTPLVAH